MGSRPRSICFRALMVILGLLNFILRLAVHPLAFLGREISGRGRRYHRLRSRMVDERPPLPDSDYLQAVGAVEADASLWLDVRSCMAEFCDLPPEAIHTGDPMLELWTMRWIGPDYLDMVFRLERTIGVKIRSDDLEAAWREMPMIDQDFGAFAELTVRALRRIREDEQGPP